MKKTTTILSICLFLLAATTLQGQILIAKWTFPTGTATDSLADGGLPVNLTKGIHTEGGTSAIDFTKNGATTKSAQATGWDNGSMSKCWVVSLNTLSYDQLKLSSKQQSGGNNPGPRDYKVQYRVQATGEWVDVPNSTIITANDWSTGVLTDIDLPQSCSGQSLIYLRWIMTSNTNSSGGTVAANGIDKIDDIYITGEFFTGLSDLQSPALFTVTPNPSDGPVRISSADMISSLKVMDMNGRIVFSNPAVNNTSATLKTGFVPKGIYFVRILTQSGQTGTRKVILL